jgi:hypothetical protein
MTSRAITNLRVALLLAPLALLSAVSCKSGDGGGGGENPLATALIDCGLLTPGQLPASSVPPDAFATCIQECLSMGSCAHLEAYVCVNAYEPLYQTCDLQCLETHGHHCGPDTLPPSQVCDGFVDCDDGSDEDGCPSPFVCGNGDQIAAAWRCDGYPDCEDMLDEYDCPPEQDFMCGDGTQIPAQQRCDFVGHCPDGSDEADCAMVNCSDDVTTGPSETG